MVKYIEPVKNGRRQGRNPNYPPKMVLLHKPFVRAVARYVEEEEIRAVGTALGILALKGSKRLRDLYKEELTREDGDVR